MLNCQEVAQQLSDAIDGEVGLLTRLRIRLHLLMCPPCKAMERSLQRTVEGLRALGREPDVVLDDDLEAP